MNKTKSEYLTIKDFASQAHVTVQSIYKKIREKPDFMRYVATFNKVKMIHKSALQEVYGISDGADEASGQPEESKPDSNQQMELIDLLKEQLRAKDKQIADLTEALKAEQILRSNADQRIKLLESRTDQPEAGTKEPEPIEVKMEPAGEAGEAGGAGGASGSEEAGGTEEETKKPLSVFMKLRKLIGR